MREYSFFSVKFLFVFCLVFLFSSCAGSRCEKLNVCYFDSSWSSNENNSKSIYIDAFGSIYPDNTLSKYTSKTSLSNSLQEYFLKHKGVVCAGELDMPLSAMCEAVADSETLEEKQELSKEQESKTQEKWEASQTKLVDFFVKSLAGDLKKENYDSLVVLIHGFNVDKGKSEYEFIKDRIGLAYQSRGPSKPFFLEVYWDGNKAGNIPKAWRNAQGSGPLIGLRLRNVINELYPRISNLPLRILTHSSGAFVAGSIFGNPVSANPRLLCSSKNSAIKHKFAREIMGENSLEGRYAIPMIENVRIFMVAPATPAKTFTGAGGSDCDENTYKNGNKYFGLQNTNVFLISTINEKDRVLISGSYSGDACLGWNKECVERLKADSSARGYNYLNVDANFNLSIKNHGVKQYFRQTSVSRALDVFIKP